MLFTMPYLAEAKLPRSLLGYRLHLFQQSHLFCSTPGIILREDHDGHNLLGEQDGRGSEEGGLVGGQTEHLPGKA